MVITGVVNTGMRSCTPNMYFSCTGLQDNANSKHYGALAGSTLSYCVTVYYDNTWNMYISTQIQQYRCLQSAPASTTYST